jgi:aspartate kinase
MALIVQKYGGSSVGTLDRINHVARKIIKMREAGHELMVVVSAMYGETDRLLQLANNLTPEPVGRELDVLISTGEQITIALLSMALNAKGCPARSYSGPQAHIYTDSNHTKARILQIKTERLMKDIHAGYVVVVAGFQGVTEQGDITTLGRGGSDTTAVALSIAAKADECQIYTDVDGVYTTDPHLIKEARLLPEVSFEEMLEMASLGAKVLQMRSVELASKHNMPIRVLSTFSDGPGTLVTFEERIMHKRLISGIAFSKEEAIISLFGVPRRIGIEGLILNHISEADIEIDMIAQHTSNDDTIDFTFTVQRRECARVKQILQMLNEQLAGAQIKTKTNVAKLSLVGIGMRSHSGVASTMFQALGKAQIPIQMITTSEIKISVVIDECFVEQGVRAIHQAFELDKASEKNLVNFIE